MLDMSEVISDPDLVAPQQYAILRSTGAWVAGGFQSTVSTIQQFAFVNGFGDEVCAACFFGFLPLFF